MPCLPRWKQRYASVSSGNISLPPSSANGPVFFDLPIPIEPTDTPETLAAKVNRAEHEWQPRVLNYIVHGQVRLVGKEVVYETEELKRRLMPEAE